MSVFVKKIISLLLLVMLATFPSLILANDDVKFSQLSWKSNDGTGKIIERDGSKIAIVEVPEGSAKGQHYLSASIDLNPYINTISYISIRARWSGVSKPSKNYFGVKFMLEYIDSDGKEIFRSRDEMLHGDSDWVELSRVITPTTGSKSAKFRLGLQESSGKIEFDLNTLKIETTVDLEKAETHNYQVSYPEKVTNGIRRRGVMVNTNIKQKDFETLKEWNVNLIRYQFFRNWGKINTDTDLEEYDSWVNGRIDHLENVLKWAEEAGIKVVIDQHTPPGGRIIGKEMRMFLEKKYFDHYIEVWKRIATRFKGNPNVWAYDLVNEPNQKTPTPYDYWTVQKTAAEAIRAIDPDTPIIVESNDWDSPNAYKYLLPIPMDNVIYQVHMYNPMNFTHQGIQNRLFGVTYPGKIDGIDYNKEQLRKVLQPVRDFQLKHHAIIYVGEFSAIRWASGAEQYLTDCIEIFEEYGWHWSYHAFRESRDWSLELVGENRKSYQPSENNPRKEVILKAFQKNQHE